MRFIFSLIFLAGLALGVGTHFYSNYLSGRELGEWRVYERGKGFTPIKVALSETDAPLNILVNMTAIGQPTFAHNLTVLTLVVDHAGRTVLADTLDFVNANARDTSPQVPDRIFGSRAGPLTNLAPGDYTFTFGLGDAERIDMRHVDVELRAGIEVLDPRYQPIGFAMMAVGVIGFVLASRRRRGGGSGGNPNSQPPPPRWGRDASGPR